VGGAVVGELIGGADLQGGVRSGLGALVGCWQGSWPTWSSPSG
jgi:uncharacterized protein YqgC (DUF456 family)